MSLFLSVVSSLGASYLVYYAYFVILVSNSFIFVSCLFRISSLLSSIIYLRLSNYVDNVLVISSLLLVLILVFVSFVFSYFIDDNLLMLFSNSLIFSPY